MSELILSLLSEIDIEYCGHDSHDLLQGFARHSDGRDMLTRDIPLQRRLV